MPADIHMDSGITNGQPPDTKVGSGQCHLRKMQPRAQTVVQVAEEQAAAEAQIIV